MTRKDTAAHHRSTARNFNRLSILLICLFLAVAATVFSLWYNLRHVSSSAPGIFDLISQRLEKGFTEPNFLSNR